MQDRSAMNQGAAFAADACGITRRAFTLVEILLAIAVILVLMALLLPVIGMIRNQSYRAGTAKMVSELTTAFDAYREEDPHHFYPTPNPAHWDAGVGAYYLDYNPADPASTLVMLERQTVLANPTGPGVVYGGYAVSHANLDTSPTSPTVNCLVDPWTRPIYYWLDGSYFQPGHVRVDTLMNGVADRPAGYNAAVAAAGGTINWNARGTEPFAYIWSMGQLHNGNTDLLPANYQNWIYVTSTP